MPTKKPLSRREFLRGTGGIMISLPFLEAMLPSMASAAPLTPRFVSMYGGVPQARSLPTTAGLLPSTMPVGMKSIEAVRQYVSVLSKTRVPQYQGTPTEPGSAFVAQHGNVPKPMLSGVTSVDATPYLGKAHTVDQIFADAFGGTTKFKSLQIKLQAQDYGGGHGSMSSRYVNGLSTELAPLTSPTALFTKLFSGSTAPSPTVNTQIAKKKSILDLTLDQAARLSAMVSGSDKVRLEQHFEEIRNIERSLATTTTPPAGGGCTTPAAPPADPAVTIYGQFGGWADEILRGQIQADILAMALVCDLTRAASWMITNDQCFMESRILTGTPGDIHNMAHLSANDPSLLDDLKLHFDFHCAQFARLVQNLQNKPEGTGTVLDSTFIGMGFGEGRGSHDRQEMGMLIAGVPSKLKMGEHHITNGAHPTTVFMAGLNALGMNLSKIGEVSGPLAQIMR